MLPLFWVQRCSHARFVSLSGVHHGDGLRMLRERGERTVMLLALETYLVPVPFERYRDTYST